MTGYERHLQGELDRATGGVSFEASSPALWKTVERLASVVMAREKASGRVRGFAVRCDEETNEGAAGLTVEVSYLPPAPRAKAVVIRLRGPSS